MAHSVAQLQAENISYELECIDRMYLNCYVPKLIQRNEAALEQEADKWAKAFLGAREDLLVASRHAIRKFREDVESDQIRVKDFRELPHLLAALDKACAVADKDKQPEPGQNPNKYGLDLELLASRPQFIRPAPVPVPEPIEV